MFQGETETLRRRLLHRLCDYAKGTSADGEPVDADQV
jgi:hypothetical protein